MFTATKTINLGQSVTLEMVLIPGGSFMMGSSPAETGRYDDEGPQHQATLSAFLMGRYPITQAQWRAVASLPQVQRELNPDPSRFKGDKRPVEQVNWYEALEFCDRLSAHTGQTYTLPSEAQWEYACRAGTTTPFHFGDTITTNLANFYSGLQEDYSEETTEVGSFFSNAWGFYDMHGNVWEWCLDHYHNSYRDAPPDGSAWETEGDSYRRILRGGSWFSASRICRSAFRNAFYPNIRHYSYGFRVVSVPHDAPQKPILGALSPDARASYMPQNPADLVDALQEPIHRDVGRSKPARTARTTHNRFTLP